MRHLLEIGLPVCSLKNKDNFFDEHPNKNKMHTPCKTRTWMFVGSVFLASIGRFTGFVESSCVQVLCLRKANE